VTVLVAVVVGFLGARLVWLTLRPVFGGDVFRRVNYRGHELPTAVGLVLGVAVVAIEAVRIVAAAAMGDGSRISGPRLGVLVLAVGLSLLGFVDDLAGDGSSRGFRGHVRELLRGRLTTGGLKLFGGGAVAMVAVTAVRPSSDVGMLLADAVLVALAANVGNLFDRAPGRTIKVSSVAFVVLVVATRAAGELSATAVVVGGALALLLDDLHERMMLGDTGANLLGGVLGLAVVGTGAPAARLAVLGVLFLLNLVSEWVSFSAVIERVPPLRVLDRAGRREGPSGS
jgi:UDP-N-acetylmuramyl pentapeptide phosphotransferase/UDP-N-acetylglucosamine-1-phosphate transferase